MCLLKGLGLVAWHTGGVWLAKCTVLLKLWAGALSDCNAPEILENKAFPLQLSEALYKLVWNFHFLQTKSLNLCIWKWASITPFGPYCSRKGEGYEGSRLCQRHNLGLCTSDAWGVFLIKLHISNTEQKSHGALGHGTYLLKDALTTFEFCLF